MNKTDHLAKAKDYIAIAESGDSKREAYKKAAEEIAAHKAETGDSDADVATSIGEKERRIRALREWRDTGYEAATPWLADKGATDRAALSHTRKVIRERPEALAKAISEAAPEAQRKIADGIVRSGAEPSLRAAVEPRKPRQPKSATDSLAEAAAKSGDVGFALWAAHDRFVDEPQPSDEERVRMLAAIDGIAESSERNARIATSLRRLFETGELEDELASLLDEAKQS